MAGYSFTGEEGALNIPAGFKLDALDQNGLVPELAMISEVIIPTGDEDVASDELEGEIRFAGGFVLSKYISIGGNANFAERQGTSSDEHFFEISSLAVFRLVFTDRLGSFIDYYIILHNDPAAEDSQSVDGGFTYLARNRVQLDVFNGTSLDKAADDYIAGAGIAFVW
ncbi:MAG TPA: transporter [Gammaproteobacteria bacterium]|nr:transporter [Gammaproteobacteria bacterium]